MIRVVIDTNIVVSALFRSGGLPTAVFNLAVVRVIQMCVSEPILAEYAEVLSRRKFDISLEQVQSVLARIREAAEIVESKRIVTAALDADDNMFLECAEAADAHYLVTGNTADFPDAWGSTRVVSPRQFLEVIAGFERGE